MKKKRNAVEWAMHYRQVVILVVTCLVAFGMYSLPNMRKNEFPDFTIRQGIVVAVAPGNTAEEMEEQVAKPLENYIFTYKEVRKEKTFSMSQDGIVYIQVQLNDEITDKDAFWSKFKHGVQAFKSELPENVLGLVVNDDFGDTSALLITMESKQKTYRELSDLMDDLQDRLRQITTVGRMTVSGMVDEQISVYLDNDRLSKYGLSDQMIAAVMAQKGFTFSGGRIKSDVYSIPIHVAKSVNNVYNVEQQIVYTTPAGENIRLKDIATVKREYPVLESYITNNGTKCLLLSVEMKKGYNVVAMGNEINAIIEDFETTLPEEVSIYRITDQSTVVDDSVTTFLTELLIAIVAVVIVVMLLLPMRVALVAASTIPITIFISLSLFYAFDIELNTVTLAALIVTLGMIVDNSIVIIDNYLETIGEGVSRWHASISSTMHFFKSIFSATLAISITFFPFLFCATGQIHDFLVSFPWAITIVLATSLLIATLLVPFMQFYFIRKPLKSKEKEGGKKSFSFLDFMQKFYDKLLAVCIHHPVVTILVGIASVVVGIIMLSNHPVQIMPTAERNQFAVEIYLPTGTTVERTASVADSLRHILEKDDRIESITAFMGCSSPRFHTAYAPQIGGTNFAQFIVNTVSEDATVELLDENAYKYDNAFPEAVIKFKQLSYSEPNCPIEVRISCTDMDSLRYAADKVMSLMQGIEGLELVRTNFNEPQAITKIELREDEATRLGVTNASLETTLAMRYGSGTSVTNVWEDDHKVPVVLKSLRSDSAIVPNLNNEMIAVSGGMASVPLRQIADIVPSWQNGQRVRRNGVPTITVMCDLARGGNAIQMTSLVEEAINDTPLPSNISIAYGGEVEENEEKMLPVIGGLGISAAMIFFILLSHFRNVNLAALVGVSMLLCFFGASVGLKVQGVDFSITSVLGLVSLMGIIVRNGIIMIDYAEELRETERLSVRDAIWHSASRRMRPIFLTSAAASMGVIPMILGGSGLWMPMGTVICYGTLISMVFILTVIPVAYMLMFRGSSKRRALSENLEKQ